MLSLYDGDSILIDWLEYDPGMHDNDYFGEGGWALERLDPDRICMSRDNWATSISREGGTPGGINSRRQSNPDRLPPVVQDLYLPDDSTLVIEFSETMEAGSMLDPLNYSVDRGYGHPDEIECIVPWNRRAILHYDAVFETGIEYRLEISENLKDCANLSIASPCHKRFARPLSPVPDEVLISEILFDPRPYCPRFIEIHNPGSGTFDLADIRIGRREKINGPVESVVPVYDGHYLFFPGDYLALTNDPDGLLGCHYVPDPGQLVLCRDLPAMNDREGIVVILDKYLQILDECYYSREMHYPMLVSEEGVSLERISFGMPSGHEENWHSAAATEGYATPGRANSQQYILEGQEGITVEPEIFSPDGDGRDDLLVLGYDFPSPGNMATILIIDPRGRIIKKITENHLLGSTGFFTWDGSNESGRRARAGIYLIYMRIFNAKGEVSRYKETCILSPGTRY
jgi:hypothetical protein